MGHQRRNFFVFYEIENRKNMKTVIKIGLLASSLLIFCFSCKKETKHEMSLELRNNTENNITVELFPNSEYKREDDMYHPSDIGSGYRYSKFTINVNSKQNIFISENINQQPCELLLNVFDSIHISINDGSQHLIQFSKDAVVGYSENIFTDNSIWLYEIKEDSREDFRPNPIEVHSFTIEISTDKLIK